MPLSGPDNTKLEVITYFFLLYLSSVLCVSSVWIVFRVAGLGPWHLLWARGRCLFGPVFWGTSGCETGLLLLGWNGPREHERVWSVTQISLCSLPFSSLVCLLIALNSPPEIVDQPGVDIFGQVYNQWKNKECECPNCKRLIAASRFAPHLEKCLGMGRNSSRIANRRWVSRGGSGVIVRRSKPFTNVWSGCFFVSQACY